MKNNLRLTVIEPNDRGGLIHYMYQLCTALANEDLDVTLITGKNYEMSDLPHNFRVNPLLKLWQRFDPASMKQQYQSRWKRLLRKAYWSVRQAYRAMRLILAWVSMTSHLLRERPDIILFTRRQFSFETFFIKILRSRGLVLSEICHEFEAREHGRGISAMLMNIGGDVYEQFSMIFFHAKENRDKFLSFYPEIPPGKTHIIEHGNSEWLKMLTSPAGTRAALMQKYGLHEGERMVLFFGLLAPSKGLEDLIDGFALASQSCDAKLVIAGYPTKHIKMDELLQRVHDRNISDKVFFDSRYIPSEEIPTLMELATCVVYPYRTSTQSGALQVAYTFGRPVIATNTGGLPEAVEDGKSGFLVPPQTPEALAEKISLLVNDPQLAAQMGSYARHLSETRFSWRSVAKEIVRVYDRLLEAETGRRSTLEAKENSPSIR